MDPVTLASQFSVTPETPEAKRVSPSISRVPYGELELAYVCDPIIFNGINKIVQTIMSAHYEIKAKDPKVQKYFDEFVAQLGSTGSGYTWDELLTATYKHECIYGWAWIENIYDKKTKDIIDWESIDPKRFDYAKNAQRKIAMDRMGKPLGYVQTLPMMEGIEIPPQNPPPQVSLESNQIFIEPKDISPIKLYCLGDGFYPIGLIEPCYKSVLRKLNINEAIANSYWRHGFPTVWAQVGDQSHEPTPTQIKSVLDSLKDLNSRKEIATPYYYKLNMLESKESVSLNQQLNIFIDDEIAAMGVPKPFATGTGEETNRSTLGSMSDLFQLTMKDIINNTCQQIRRSLFAPLCKQEGFTEIPKLEWDVVGVGELDAKQERLLNYVKAGLIDVTPELKNYIKRLEKL